MSVKPLFPIFLIIILASVALGVNAATFGASMLACVDDVGPTTYNIVITPSYNNGIFNLTAITEDTYSPIKTAEYFIGHIGNASCGLPGTGTPIYPLDDGSFDLDNLIEYLKGEDITLLQDGLNWACVQAQDAVNNWGNCACAYFETDASPPYYPYNIYLDDVLNPNEYLVCGNNPWLNATVCDKESYIQGGEYFIDLAIPPIPAPGSGNWMNMLQNFTSFGYKCAVIGNSVDILGLSDGTHTIRIRGEDHLENWGKLQYSPIISFIKDTTAPSTVKTLNPFEGAQFDCYGYEESEADVYNKSPEGLTDGCYYIKNGTTITLSAEDFDPEQTGEFSGNVIIHYKVWWKQNPGDSWALDQSGSSTVNQSVTLTLNKGSYHLIEYWAEDLCTWQEEHHFELDIVYECKYSEIARGCAGDGYSNVTHAWNYGFCGEPYTQLEADPNCRCQYGCWENDSCVSDGYMRQVRNETSGYPYCTDSLEQDVPDEVCGCDSSETGRECVSDGFADVTYNWNYYYCGDAYSELVEDAQCSCQYTEWTDSECVSDGFMKQVRTEYSGYTYCAEPLEQEIPNDACDCESEETLRACVEDGFANVTYSWNYDYCGASYDEVVEDSSCSCEYTCWEDESCVADGMMRQRRQELSGFSYCTDSLEQDVPDESCDCESSESDRVCVSDGYADVTYSWNFDYCGEQYNETVQDFECSCDYTEWIDSACVSDGFMRQVRIETSGYSYCEEPLEQEVPNDACNCTASETGRECVSDGFADVSYVWNYDYCGNSYNETLQDSSCLCVYTDWQDDACVLDGFMRQIRNETSGYAYCVEPLEREVQNELCSCESSESVRLCIGDGFANVTYSWNYDYCGDSYEETVQDSSCSCNYTEWTDSACVSDGFMEQMRTETSGYAYCAEPLEQNVSSGVCSCNLSESARACVSDGYAQVTYNWNFDYCGVSYNETVQDQLCACNYTDWQDDACISDGYLRQLRNETSGNSYCTGSLQQDVPNEMCSCNYTSWQDDACFSDGFMRQLRNETSGHEYCSENLTRNIENATCSCISTEIARECTGNAIALASYSWNYQYCGQNYSLNVYDESCRICIPNWICSGYARCSPGNYQYCTQVYDSNSCELIYSGNYSEFARSCNYCSIHGAIISGTSEISVYEGALVTLDVKAADQHGNPVPYTISAPVGNDGIWQTKAGDHGTYYVTVTAFDGICTSLRQIKIVVKQKGEQSLMIPRTFYENFLKPSEQQELYVTVKNTGTQAIDGLKITVSIDNLGIMEATPSFELSRGEEKSSLIEFRIPSSAPKGKYYMRIVVSNDDIRRVIYRDFDVV